MIQTPGDDIIEEFKRRRSRTGKLIRPWLFILAAGWAAALIPFVFHGNMDELWTLNCFFGGFLVIIVAMIRIIVVVNREYRCPYCNRTLQDFKS